MDTKEILLEKNRSKFSVNRDSYINLDLKNKARLIPFNNISDTLNLKQLYNNERDNCDKYRMIFTINPICSNVLFNAKTEVVRYEGSSNCIVLTDNSNADKGYAINNEPLSLIQAIRDTEYSHPELFKDETPYVYHCGVDIFNNHMLRNNDFVYVNKTLYSTSGFNTIQDFVRNNDGNKIKEDVAPGFATPKPEDIHLYQYDTILSMYDAFANRLKIKDGWYGFNNSTNIAIPNVSVTISGETKDLSINKIMNNNKACEFIDLYPDRSLYSFVPKLNKYRRRVEKNWDYCITYPKYKDSGFLNDVCGIDSGITENNGGCSIKIIEAKRTYSNSGSNVVRMKTLFKHNLKVGDYITLFYYGSTFSHINSRIRVISVGDYQGLNKERYFTIQYKDISSKFDFIEEGYTGGEDVDSNDIVFKETKTKVQFYYKKNVNGVDCQYYFRKFVKITKSDGKDLTSEINKLAYGENIYGDRIAQIVFTDDIDVEGLTDYRGRPLTEVYFTVIKRNAGYKEWYENDNFKSEVVEFSHCFGEVTTGLDLPSEVYKYNVRKLNNIKFKSISGYTDLFSENLWNKEKYDNSPIQSGLTISGYTDSEPIFADIVEYDPVSDYEQVLEVVYHRFNTAQRETLNGKYSAITYDDLIADDYDFSTTSTSAKTGDGIIKGFTVSSYTISRSSTVDTNNQIQYKNCPGNINPEGYFYNPYTRIKIRELSEEPNKVIGKVIKFTSLTNKSITINGERYNGFKITTSIDYNLIKNDTLCIYNNETKDIIWGVIYDVDKTSVTVILNQSIRNSEEYTIVSTDEGVPAYATYLPSSHSFVWRNIVPMSELSNDSDINDMPFSNGRKYIEKNVNFFLKRQDPTGEYGLLNFDTNAKYKSNLGMYRINGWEPIDLSNDLYNNGSLGDICY